MRHFRLHLAIGTLAIAGGIDACAAAPLDFLFGGPPLAERPAYRLRRHPAAPLPPQPQVAIPLPVPRPHFPGDPPDATTAAETGTQSSAPVSPLQPENPPATTTLRDRDSKPAFPDEPKVPPLPPPKPDEFGTASQPPATPEEAPRSEATKSEATKSDFTKSEAPKSEAHAATTPEPAPPGPAAPTPPAKPAELTSPSVPGKPAAPAVAPSGATTAFTPRAPEDDPQCPSRLLTQKVGIEQTTIGPQPDARCTVVEPVHLVDVAMPDGGKITFPEHPTVACVTADSFSSYVRDLLAPLARGTFGASVTAVWTGPGLECRSRDHIFGAKLSAHGQGLAIDIAELKLADGRMIEVGTPKTDAETAFETAARAGACGYFHTVLGPGSDAYHRTHWHFDLEVRGAHGDSKYCK